MKSTKSKRNIGIDLLRVASIFYIVGFWHMLDYTKAIPNYNNFVTIRLTYIILGTFVFISGYFLGLPKNNIGKHNILLFFKKRFLRIYPLYLLSILLFTFFNLSNTITSLKAACLLSMFARPAPPTLWFITMIMLFYLITPLTIHYCRNINAKINVIIYLITLIIFLLVYHYLTRLLDIRLVAYLPSFVIGIYVANNNINLNKYLVLVILAITVILSTLNTGYDAVNLLLKTPMILCGSYICYMIAQRINIKSSVFQNNITFFGYSSFCMYLFHRPIYIALKKLYFPETYFFQLTYLIFICFPCIIFISHIIQKTFDTNTNKLTNHSTRPAGTRVFWR